MGTTNLSDLAIDNMTLGSSGTQMAEMRVYTATIDPAAVAAATSAEQTFTVAGLAVGDMVVVSKPTATAGVGIVGARVSAANTLALTYMNATAGSLDPASESYTILAFRPAS